MKKEILRIENLISDDVELTNLQNMNLRIYKGEIMGLIPINGTGRDKLLELLCKNVPINLGRIYLDNKLVNSYQHSDNRMNRVYIIEQKSKLIGELSVLDNIYVLRNIPGKVFLNHRQMERQFQWMKEELDVKIKASLSCNRLGSYERCVVEIMKAIAQGTKLIVLNSLSDVLNIDQMQSLKRLLLKLSADNYSFLYLCSHYEEVVPICNRITFMRDGKDIKVFDKNEIGTEVFRKFTFPFVDVKPPLHEVHEEIMMSVSHFRTDSIKDLSFEIKKGECLVLYDAGKTIPKNFIESLIRGGEKFAGSLKINGEKLEPRKVRKYLGSQICVIGVNPLDSMIFYDMSYVENICIRLGKKINKILVKAYPLKNVQTEYENILGSQVCAKDLYRQNEISLYNLIYYRVHLMNPKVVIIEQPFYNTDIYLRKHIIKLISMLKAKGIATIVLSVDLSEGILIADRLIALRDGRISKVYGQDSFSSIRLF